MSPWTPTSFEPWAGLAGGLLIGIAVVFLLLALGRIAGISGITAGILTQQGYERHWRLAFLCGMLLGPVGYSFIAGPFPVQLQVDSGWMILAGLLVGFGTRLGSGCTSGHGVAGIARLSLRSIVATLVFFCAAVLTTTFIRHLLA